MDFSNFITAEEEKWRKEKQIRDKLIKEILKIDNESYVWTHNYRNSIRNTYKNDLPSTNSNRLQSLLTSLKNGKAKAKSFSSIPSNNNKKGKKKKSKFPKNTKSKQRGNKDGSFVEAESKDYNFDLAYKIINLYSYKKKVKEVNYTGIVPYYYGDPIKLFPNKKVKNITPPVLFVRSKLTHYMSDDMKALIRALEHIYKEKQWPILRYQGQVNYANNETVTQEMLKDFVNKTIINVTCGCAGGMSFRPEIHQFLNDKTNYHVLTHYGENQNCGCSTFTRLNNFENIKVIRNITKQ